jgi:hypothetical protein
MERGIRRMNLDRFSQGLADAQEMPIVELCKQCSGEMNEGDEAVGFNDETFCGSDCLIEYALEKSEGVIIGAY